MKTKAKRVARPRERVEPRITGLMFGVDYLLLPSVAAFLKGMMGSHRFSFRTLPMQQKRTDTHIVSAVIMGVSVRDGVLVFRLKLDNTSHPSLNPGRYSLTFIVKNNTVVCEHLPASMFW